MPICSSFEIAYIGIYERFSSKKSDILQLSDKSEKDLVFLSN